ncbi:hypothetical protein CHS0354_006720 [Potamilus streckersoni]|uniref:Uncharacterized protein n=1 Tax=Potamilus streckersoni TaxID=2493646 RepID=A0AAE0T5B6_9BIVA|nr:hypothetical protein CHS0354_006720 [Potamilus streckersoni]
MGEKIEHVLGSIYLYADNDKPKKSSKPILDFICRMFRRQTEQMEDKRQALIKKNGNYRIRYTGLDGQRRKFLFDLYISLIDLKWRYALAFFFNAFLTSFVIFSVLWWLMCYNHGDFEADNIDNPKWNACISGIKNFETSLLFAIETQTTVGYGFAYPNTDCGGSIILVYLQVTVERLLESFLLGFIFVKFAQPTRRRNTLKFSKHACISQEDGNLILQIRVGDMRQSHLLDATVHGVMVKRLVTDEGFLYPLYTSSVKFQADAMNDKLVLMWPVILRHIITKDSPFWGVKPADLSNEKYELIVCIEGTLETTGEFCQARTSYTPKEILWGHRFDRIDQFDSGNGIWEIDFDGFNDVVYYENIYYSAKELSAIKSGQLNLSKRDGDMEVTEKKKESPPNLTPKTIPYDSEPPELPARDHRFISERGTKTVDENDSDKTLNACESKSTKLTTHDGTLSVRTSVISADYLTADDELSLEEGDCSNGSPRRTGIF